MYVLVPKEMQESLLREVKRGRLRSSVLHFPVLLLILLVIGAGIVFIKGHMEVEAIHRLLVGILPDRLFWLLLWAGLVAAVLGLTIFMLVQIYRECRMETYLFCETCKAVDAFDTGHCPICSKPLSTKGEFFYTHYSKEEKLLERRGLQSYRKA